MTRLIPKFTISCITVCAAAAMAADIDSNAELKAATDKLASQPNYSWTSTTKLDPRGNQNFRMGPTQGKTEKDGWSHTATSFNDNSIETFIKGTKGAMKRDDEWLTVEDLESDDRGAFMARRIKGFKTPAIEAAELASQAKELKKGDGGEYSGELTEDGAKALLTRWGRRGGDGPSGAKGSVKFWIKDGVLSRFQWQVQGTFRRDDGEDRKTDRTTTVEIKDIGSTKLVVPAEVKKKLS
jgi:hypothetical protein